MLEHHQQLSQFYLPETQTSFSALPEQSLQYCREDVDRHPFVILADGIPVGFVLPEFAKGIFPNKDSIILAVDAMNVIAKTLYEKSGFQDTGIQKQGRSGWMEIMEYRL
ncbi:hypothetical protein ASG65_24150 [Bacillus sp. Leaf13]|nr:hypothetical protein ASG65_24150 [Bacillus sp. Leaf13]